MFVTGALIWANLNERIEHTIQQCTFDEGATFRDVYSTCKYFGWPYEGLMTFRWGLDPPEKVATPPNSGHFTFFYTKIAVDVMIYIWILIAVWFVCEFLIPRRAARKGA